MTRYIYLLRHAQSAEKQVGQSDRERSLTPTGLRQVVQVGNFLQKNNFQPQLILSSTADRAQQTAQQLVDVLKLMPEIIQLEEELYEASTRTFFNLLKDQDDAISSILYVAHNPTITYLAEYLTKAQIDDMPPAGLVLIELHVDSWNELSEASGRLLHFVTPEILSHEE